MILSSVTALLSAVEEDIFGGESMEASHDLNLNFRERWLNEATAYDVVITV